MTQLPSIFTYDFDDPQKPKPWADTTADTPNKYFNYGFTEQTWRVYASNL